MNTAREINMTRVEIDRALSMIRAGDESGWDRLLRSLRADMVPLLIRRGCEDSVAEDLAQEALEVVWRRLSTLKNPDRIRSWAMSIVLNRMRSHNRRCVSVETIEDAHLLHEYGPEQSSLHREAQAWLSNRMAELRPLPRKAVFLRLGAGFEPRDASECMGVSRRRLRRLLYSGLLQLRRCAATADGRAVGRVLQAVG